MLGKGLCDRRCNSIGIGVEDVTFAVMSQGSNNWHNSAFNKRGKELSINLVDITHEAEVHHLLCSVVHLDKFGRTFMTTDNIAVDTSQTDCFHALCLQTCHDILVNQASINHRHDLEHLGIRYATTANHPALDAETCSHRSCQSAATMH